MTSMEIYCFFFSILFSFESFQSQDDSQLSNTGSQAKQKRKLAKPRKVRKRKGIDQGQNTITLKEVGWFMLFNLYLETGISISFVEKWKGEGSYVDALGCSEIFTERE